MKKILPGIILFLMSLSVFAQEDSTATIHFYRTNSMKGAAVTYAVKYDSTVVGVMKLGSIYSLTVTPGVKKFTAKTGGSEFIFVQAKAGEEYFIKCSLSMGVLVGRPKLEQMSKEEGRADVEKIKSKQKTKK